MITSRRVVRILGPEAVDGLRVTDPGTRFRVCVSVSDVNALVPGEEIDVVLRSHKRVLARILTVNSIAHGLFMHVHAEVVGETHHA